VKAFKQNAIDFILKPVDFNAIILAVYKVIKTKWNVPTEPKVNAIQLLNSSNQVNNHKQFHFLRQD
jgi:two-component system LytT family response regulator